MKVAFGPEASAVLAMLTQAAMAIWLLETAARAGLRRHQKASGRPKKPPAERRNDPVKPAMSKAALLATRKMKKYLESLGRAGS